MDGIAPFPADELVISIEVGLPSKLENRISEAHFEQVESVNLKGQRASTVGRSDGKSSLVWYHIPINTVIQSPMSRAPCCELMRSLVVLARAKRDW